MSIVNYLGCNFLLPDIEGNLSSGICYGENFSDEKDRENVRSHLNYKHIYEIFTVGKIGFWFNSEYNQNYPADNEASQKTFLELCNALSERLKKGETCGFYTCWVGEELEERDAEMDYCIELGNFDVNQVEIYEKTLLCIKNKGKA